MKILKTSEWAKAKQKAKQKAKDDAFAEMFRCPECNRAMRFGDIGKSKKFLGGRHAYVAECPVCGCRWQSEAF